MRKKILQVLVTIGFLISVFGILPTDSLEVAYAKPPDWAPAHGYRRKQGEESTKNWKNKYAAWRDIDSSYSWTFTRIDINDDGRISLKEWNEDKELFIILDRNRDGYISPAEYARIDEERGLLSILVAKVKDKVGSFFSWLF